MLAFDLVIDEHKIALININDQTLILLVFMKKFERLFLHLIILLCSLWGFKLKATIYTLIIYMQLIIKQAIKRQKIWKFYKWMTSTESCIQTLSLYLEEKNPLRLARLGYILISESFSNVVNNISVKPGYWSDHSAVIMEIYLIILLKGMVSES